jgi:hypothetical protein
MHTRTLALGAVAAALASVTVLPGPARGAPPLLAGTTRISSLPYDITAPGRYIVTSSLTGVAGSNGITVSASDVTLELCGYTLFGVSGSLIGVRVDPGHDRVHVLDGGVRGWDSGGVIANLSSECIFQDLFLADNGGLGGLSAGDSALIEGVHSHDNLGDGIGGTGDVLECIAAGNGVMGIDLNGLVSLSTSGSNGFDGVNVGGDSRVETCLSFQNDGDGFSTGSGPSFSACLALDNGAHGIVANGSARVAECLSVGNGENGISVGDRSMLSRNLAADNSQQAGTGAGILASGSWSRIDENELHGNPTGLGVSGSDNVVIRNSASDNTTDFNVAAGNYFFVNSPSAVNGWINFHH